MIRSKIKEIGKNANKFKCNDFFNISCPRSSIALRYKEVFIRASRDPSFSLCIQNVVINLSKEEKLFLFDSFELKLEKEVDKAIERSKQRENDLLRSITFK